MNRNANRSIVIMTNETISADDMIERWEHLLINATKGVDKGVTSIESQDAWYKLRIHGIPLRRFMGKGTEGLQKLCEELEAENPSCQTLPGARWLGNPVTMKEKMRKGEQSASTVVVTVKGRGASNHLLQHKAMIGGLRYTVDRYIPARPDSMCETCCGLGHLQSKCATPTMPRCAFCAGKHTTVKHQCPMSGCNATEGQNCRHTLPKCTNCKGNHVARSRECPKKLEAVVKAKEERALWRERRDAGRNVTNTEEEKKAEEETEGNPATTPPPEDHPMFGPEAPPAPGTTEETEPNDTPMAQAKDTQGKSEEDEQRENASTQC